MVLKHGFCPLVILVERLDDLLKLEGQTLLQLPVLISDDIFVVAQCLHHEVDFSSFHQHVFLIAHVVVEQPRFRLLDGQKPVTC